LRFVAKGEQKGARGGGAAPRGGPVEGLTRGSLARLEK
jgi:hypothetical protein